MAEEEKIKIGPSFAYEVQAAGIHEGLGWNENGDIFASDPEHYAAAMKVLETHDPTKPAPRTLWTGEDAIDAMSKDNANNPAVDQRDIVRIMAAPDVRCVKSKLYRVAKACGITIEQLLPGITVT